MLVDVTKVFNERDAKLAEAIEKIKVSKGAVLIWLEDADIGCFHFAENSVKKSDLIGSLEFVKLNLAKGFMEAGKR